VAIPLVLGMTVALAIIGVFILREVRQYNRREATGALQLQAHYVARAGLEHALLKVKYLPRELYDAICLSQGRNPLFDASRPISDLNPGPIFLYRKGEATPAGFSTPGLDTALANTIRPPRTWLDAFRADLTSQPTANPVMSFAEPPRFRSLLREPFQASYRLAGLDVLARQVSESGEAAIENQLIVELTVEAEIRTSRHETAARTLTRTMRVARQ